MLFLTIKGRYGLWIPMSIMGLVCLVAGIASSFLPETLNENLPQNTADSIKFSKNKKYFSLTSTKLNCDIILMSNTVNSELKDNQNELLQPL